nr:immunoglobulin light chain junction region [Macaca mulatta]
CQHGYETPLTF